MNRRPLLIVALGAVLCVGGAAAAPVSDAASEAPQEASQYLQFVEEFTGSCMTRNGVQVLVKNTHPTRTIRVWLDRYHGGTGTGDRSRTDLAPGGAPEPLGCSRNNNAPQEWRVVRAAFVD